MAAMASRLRTLLLFFAALAGTCCLESRADIGYAQAASIARAANPGRVLVDLRFRQTNQGPKYASTCVNLSCTVLYGMDIDAETGALLGGENNEVPPDEEHGLRDVIDRRSFIELGFGAALDVASAATGAPDSAVRRCSLISQSYMIAYELRYTDRSRLLVDAITGLVVPNADAAASQNSIPTGEYLAALDRATAIAAEYSGAQWLPFGGQTAVTPDGIAIGVMFLDRAFGQVLQVDMLGKNQQAFDFPPAGTLFANVQAIRARLPQIVVTAPQFLGRIESSYPACAVSSIDLQVQANNNGIVRTRWSASLRTALGEQLEFSIDATVPVQLALGIATVQRPTRPGDFNHDGHVTSSDLTELLTTIGSQYPPHDLNQDGWVTQHDLAILLGNWG